MLSDVQIAKVMHHDRGLGRTVQVSLRLPSGEQKHFDIRLLVEEGPELKEAPMLDDRSSEPDLAESASLMTGEAKGRAGQKEGASRKPAKAAPTGKASAAKETPTKSVARKSRGGRR